jgi:hypothetical protein
MSSDANASFEPFITVSLGNVRQPYQSHSTTMIAIGSHAPGVTSIHWHDAPTARRLVATINKLIDVLDPPPTAAVQKPARRLSKLHKGSR